MKEQLALFYIGMLMNARCAHFRFLIKRDKLISALNCENHSSKVLESRFYFSDINLIDSLFTISYSHDLTQTNGIGELIARVK